MATLNRNRPFDTVHSDDEGRHYFQDGLYFDAYGEEWLAPGAPRVQERVSARSKRKDDPHPEPPAESPPDPHPEEGGDDQLQKQLDLGA